MNLLPIFVNLSGRRGLLVGAGAVALEKLSSLLPTGIRLRVVAPHARPEIATLAAEGKLEWIPRAFSPADLDGIFFAIAATDVAEVNAAVYQEAVARNIFCNSVDDIPNCNFFFGSVVRRGPLQIAISTTGESPAVAQRLRREIDAQLPADIGPWLENLGDLRREVLATHPRGEARKSLLHQLAQMPLCDSATCPTRQLARAPLTSHEAAAPDSTVSAKAFLVGAGPGDPDLLTVKALRILQAAQVVLHDDLVPDAILRLAPPTAEIVNVGKRCGVKTITQEEINALLVAHVRAGRAVVRLKSGDPLLFGRASEEMSALADAGLPFEIVPGISAGFAAAASVGVSLTSRTAASNVLFSTGHHAQSHNHAPLPEKEDLTRVVYMPGRDLTLLSLQWMQEGLPPDLPCALVSRAAQSDEQIHHTTLAQLSHAPEIHAPSLLLAGWTLRERAESRTPVGNVAIKARA
ncbi:MAG TPA: siroheme synthase CysG [Candidatus Sulfopaludibacter sp.]|nr:siroheme synthase CysG [Candidatus Sulfopaludibacter sp.]